MKGKWTPNSTILTTNSKDTAIKKRKKKPISLTRFSPAGHTFTWPAHTLVLGHTWCCYCYYYQHPHLTLGHTRARSYFDVTTTSTFACARSHLTWGMCVCEQGTHANGAPAPKKRKNTKKNGIHCPRLPRGTWPLTPTTPCLWRSPCRVCGHSHRSVAPSSPSLPFGGLLKLSSPQKHSG